MTKSDSIVLRVELSSLFLVFGFHLKLISYLFFVFFGSKCVFLSKHTYRKEWLSKVCLSWYLSFYRRHYSVPKDTWNKDNL